MMAARFDLTSREGSRLPAAHPELSVDELVGLLRTLGRLRFGRGASIASLADAVAVDDDRLLVLLESLGLLGLAEIADGRARVTVMGRRFLQAHDDERKRLFAERLQSRVALVHYVLIELQSQPEHQLPHAALARVLRDQFLIENPEMVLRQLLAWARYAGLFTYAESTGLISLMQASGGPRQR